ncbi:CIA30 family protein [Tenacibaculum sp. C7A-26P2]|uniref:CIA30 family protein n=1 Tax=Tenacibaculum sp. C7A-26P2 TaxID=3447504 RepID=UPI003F82CCCC
MSLLDVVIFDFSTDNHKNWKITNDNVMGGVSTSSIEVNENKQGVFSGHISTENNGGFAMVRLKTNIKNVLNHKEIILFVEGDGKDYQFRLKTDNKLRHWYINTFKTTKEEQRIVLKLKDFYPSFRGEKLNIGNFNSNTINEIAFLFGNKKDESFKLKIKKVFIK